MKKIFSFLLCATTAFSVCMLTGCVGKKKEALRFGLGVYTSVEATNAAEDQNGNGQAVMTVAAVLLDQKNKIVRCVLDCADYTLSYTASGKAPANESFLTKREQGAAYGMKLYGGAVKEWYEQADAFCTLVQGKTVDEVKALVASDGKGNGNVIRAGCTISVSDFVKSIEKASDQAVASSATAKDTLKLGCATIQTTEDASADSLGKNLIETTFFAATADTNGIITDAHSDCAEIELTFDSAGASQTEGKWIVSTKRDCGNSYGMKQYGGAKKEWYEQADAFDRACIGKRAGDISSLLGIDGYGTDVLQNAGCTIRVNGFVKAALKIK